MKFIIKLSIVCLCYVLLMACSKQNTIQLEKEEINEAVSPVSNQIQKSPNDSRAYRYITLSNDMSVVLVSDEDLKKSAAALAIGVGSNQETDDFLGMAHYLEHMLFLGTDKYPTVGDYSKFIAENGGSSNAYTWYDRTGYYFNVKNEAFEEALDRFSGFFINPKLYPEYALKERKAVQAELNLRGATDEYIESALLGKSVNPLHPRSRFMVGSMETLTDKPNKSLHDALLDFYAANYSANLMKLVLVGNQSLDELEKLAKKYFVPIKNKNLPENSIEIPAITDVNTQKNIYYASKKDHKKLYIEFPIPYQDKDFRTKPYRIIRNVVASEMPGTLAHSLRQMGLVDSLTASAQPTAFTNSGIFRISINLTEQGYKKKDAIIALSLQYLSLIRDKGIPEFVYEELKNSLSNDFKFLPNADEVSTASSLASSLLFYPVNHIIDAPFVLESFDKKGVQRALSHLTAENMRLWHISPNEKVDKKFTFYPGDYRIEKFAKAQQAAWMNHEILSSIQLALPTPNRYLAEDFSLLKAVNIQPKKVLSEENVTLWHVQSEKFREPKSIIRFQLDSELPYRSVVHNVLHDLLRIGFQQKETTLIDEASAARIQTSLTPANGLGIQVSGLSDKQPEYLEVLSERLVAFAISEEEFERAKTIYVQALKNQSKSFLYTQAVTRLRQVITNPSWTEDQKLKAVRTLTYFDLNKYVKDFMSSVSVHGFVYGNISEETSINIAKSIASLFQSKGNQRFLQASLKVEAGKTLGWNEVSEQADVVMIDAYFSPRERIKALAAATLLRPIAHPSFYRQLRTEEQLGYAVAFVVMPTPDNAGVAMLLQTPVKAPQDALNRFIEFREAFQVEMDNLSDETFSKIKASVLKSYTQEPKNYGEEAQRFIADWLDENESFDSRKRLVAAIEKMTKKEVQDFYRELLLEDKATRLVIQFKGAQYNKDNFAQPENVKLILDTSKVQ
ncbi:MAG: insulinase family protein [Pseudomonadota bacterium]